VVSLSPKKAITRRSKANIFAGRCSANAKENGDRSVSARRLERNHLRPPVSAFCINLNDLRAV
jgi:hypothetical protein